MNNKFSKLFFVTLDDDFGIAEIPDIFSADLRKVYRAVEENGEQLTLEQAYWIAERFSIPLERIISHINASVEPSENHYLTYDFNYTSGFSISTDVVLSAVADVSSMLTLLPAELYKSIDLKTTSAMIGALFCASAADHIPDAIVNPIEKGNPDIVPISAKDASEEELRTYPYGVEVKVTVGNVATGSNLSQGEERLDFLTGITWQAHHREGRELLGLVWDYMNTHESFSYPMITGAFFSCELEEDDWGAISGTTGRNTKVCGMKVSGKKKMGKGIALCHERCSTLYPKLLS